MLSTNLTKMKTTIFVLALFALIAASYSAPVVMNEQPVRNVILSDGKREPGDLFLATFSTTRYPNNGEIEAVNWDWRKSKAQITYVKISEVGPNTNATARITSGGVGSNSLTFEAVPGKDGAMHFELDIWGKVTF